jgi:hypothetical protein
METTSVAPLPGIDVTIDSILIKDAETASEMALIHSILIWLIARQHFIACFGLESVGFYVYMKCIFFTQHKTQVSQLYKIARTVRLVTRPDNGRPRNVGSISHRGQRPDRP